MVALYSWSAYMQCSVFEHNYIKKSFFNRPSSSIDSPGWTHLEHPKSAIFTFKRAVVKMVLSRVEWHPRCAWAERWRISGRDEPPEGSGSEDKPGHLPAVDYTSSRALRSPAHRSVVASESQLRSFTSIFLTERLPRACSHGFSMAFKTFSS